MEYHKEIIFTKTPLKGYFKFGDLFQIYPLEMEGMPSFKGQKHHPIVLEYTIKEEDIIEPKNSIEGLEDLTKLTATTLTKKKSIINLLTLFTNHLFFYYEDLTGNWGIAIDEKETDKDVINNWSSKWCMTLYHSKEVNASLKIKEFTKLEINHVPMVRHFEYYYNDPNFDYHSESEITFPNTIFIGLHSYYKLTGESKEILDTAISHCISARELMFTKKTLSIISAFTSVETMVNNEFKEQKVLRCKECGQPEYKISKKYREYLFKYFGQTENNKKKFNSFYSLRSKIIHTGLKLQTENLWNDMEEEKKDKEFLDLAEIIQMSKLSIIHWLIKNK